MTDDSANFSRDIVAQEPEFFRAEVLLTLENGLHLVPCSQIVKLAQRYPCQIRLTKQNRDADAKLMFDLMSLGAECGSVIVIECRGESASEALARMVHLFTSNFKLEDMSP
jgi:phosphotransferase system HPr (HPr) family protein